MGIVVKRNGVPYVYESSAYEHFPDIDRKSTQNGVMLSPLKERLYDHYGIVCWRPLIVPDRVEGEFEAIMEDIIKQNWNKYYDGSKLEQVKFILNLTKFENDEKFFCSELVAYCYQKLGLVSPDRASNTYLVPDFSSVGYEVTSKTFIRRVSPEDAKVKLLRDATLGGEIELLPHWVEERTNPTTNETELFPKITEILEEDLHILNGLGIVKSELMRLTNCKVLMLVEEIVGMKLDDFGEKADNWIENLLSSIDIHQLVIKATVGEVPTVPRLPFERSEAGLEVGVVSCLPFILNCESEPKYSRLKIWISIREKDIFSEPDYLGSICLDPHVFPIVDRRKNEIICSTGSETETTETTKPRTKITTQIDPNSKLEDQIESRIYLTQQGHWKMKCWVEMGRDEDNNINQQSE